MKATYLLAMVFFSIPLAAQTASFSADSLQLEIPYLTVNGRTAYEDVQLMLNASGTAFELTDFKRRSEDWQQARNITLGVGESIALDETFTLTFRGVFSDNRCPSDVICITEGEGIGLFSLDKKLSSGMTWQTLFGLPFRGVDTRSLSDRSTPSHEFRGVYFTPLVLSPYPETTEEIASEDYEVIVQVCGQPGYCIPGNY